MQAEIALLLTSDDEPGRGLARRCARGRAADRRRRPQAVDLPLPPRRHRRLRRGQGTARSPAATSRSRTNFRSNPRLLAGVTASSTSVLVAEAGVQPAQRRARGRRDTRSATSALRSCSRTASSTARRPTACAQRRRGCSPRCSAHAHERGWEIRDRRRRRPLARRAAGATSRSCCPRAPALEHLRGGARRAGIPYRAEGARDFFQRQEVRDLIWVLAAIDDPTDRSRSSARCARARSRSRRGALPPPRRRRRASYRSPTPGPERAVNDALAELRDLHRCAPRRLARRARAPRRRADPARRVRAHRPGRPAGRREPPRDRRPGARVHRRRRRRPAPFIRYLATRGATRPIEIEATVAEETDDVVRIMTIHGAKGLEFPIVALANLGARSAQPTRAGAGEHDALPAPPRRRRARRPPRIQDPGLRRRVGAREGSTSRPSGCGCSTSPPRARATT